MYLLVLEKCIQILNAYLPGFTVFEGMGNFGCVMLFLDATSGLRLGVLAAGACIGIGITVFDMREPASLMAAVNAGTLTGLGNWTMDRAHSK